MTGSLTVLLGDEVVGSLTRLSRGGLRLDYDEAYRAGPAATPLSLSMPTQVPSYPDHVVAPWLWGLLPDNQAVLDRWARQFHVSASSPFSILATPVGEDCAGAVRFVPPEEVARVLARTGDVTWLDEEGVAERLRDLREDSTAWLGRMFIGQFSLAGAQAKTALLYRDGHFGVPTGALATTHILKPAVTGFDDHDLNEHLCLAAARRAGLLAVSTRVGRFAGESAIIVDRYDRLIRGEEIVRIHQEDLCQALGLPPSRKYQNEGGPGPSDIARLLRRVMPPTVADESVKRFADALIWNWLIAGTDAHAKNYSLLLSDDQVRLAPLYDVASILPYAVHERRLKMAMKLGGDYRVHLWQDNWPKAADDLDLDPDQLVDRARELASLAPDAFSSAAADPAVRSLGRTLTAKLIDLIAGRARRCLELVGTPSAGP